MNRKYIIGFILAILGSGMIDTTILLKNKPDSQGINMSLVIGGILVICIGCYFMYKAKKERRKN